MRLLLLIALIAVACGDDGTKAFCAEQPDGTECAVEGFVGLCNSGVCAPSTPPTCGNGQIDPSEDCDPESSLTSTCEDLGFYGGALFCNACALDTSLCGGTCGDQIINGPETCDGAPPIGCLAFGAWLGTTRRDNCAIDSTACENPGWTARGNAGQVSVGVDVWGASANDIWIVGSETFHVVGSTWTEYQVGGKAWGFGPDDVYFADGKHWNGTAVVDVPGLSSAGATSLWGTSGSNLYASTSVGNVQTLERWNGSAWTDLAPPQSVHGVWGASSNAIWTLTNDAVLFYNGSTFTPENTGFAFFPHALTGCDNTVFVGGYDGGAKNVVIRRDSGVWTKLPDLPVLMNVHDMYCKHPDDLMLIGQPSSGGLAAVWYDGAMTFSVELESKPYPSGVGPAATWGSIHDRAIIAANGFDFIHQATAAWGASGPYSGKLWRSNTNVWSIGGNRIYKNGILQYTASQPLNGISGSGENFLIAVGDQGTAFSYNGTAWSALTTGTTAKLNDVWARSPTDVWAVGVGAVLRYNGTTWVSSSPSGTIIGKAVWGSGSNDVYFVAYQNMVQHYDGTSWHVLQSPAFLAPELADVWASDPKNVFVVGATGVAQRWDGTTWTKLTNVAIEDLVAVHGTAADDVFLAGKQGTVFRWDGHQLAVLRSFSMMAGDAMSDVIATPGTVYFSNVSSGGRVLIR